MATSRRVTVYKSIEDHEQHRNGRVSEVTKNASNLIVKNFGIPTACVKA